MTLGPFPALVHPPHITQVLIAVVEAMHVRTTATSEGRLLTQVVARMKNTQKQFLRARLPAAAEVWSTGAPACPSLLCARAVRGLFVWARFRSRQ